MILRSLVVSAIAAVALLAAAGAGVEAAPRATNLAAASSIDPDDITAISDLLAVRSRSVMQGDIAARVDSVDSGATTDFLEVDSRTVSAGSAIGLDAYVESLYEPVVDLTPPPGATDDGRRRLTLEVKRVMQIKGFDDRDHVSSLFMTFVETEAGWRVLADDALSGIGLGGDRELWELFDTTVERRESVLVIGTSSPARHRALANLTEQAISRFESSWPDDWSGKVVMVVPGRTSELEALLRPTIDVSKFVAFTTLAVDRTDGYEVVAPRIVAQEANLALRSAARQVEILVHELAHVASVIDSGPATPLWSHEGLAEWITAGRPTADDGPIELPDLHRFRTGSGSDIRAVYDQAATTMAQLAGEFGPDAPLALFRAVGGARRVPGSADHILDVALREITGRGLVELTN